MAQQMRNGMASARRAAASAVGTDGFVSASWCIGLAAFTTGYCFGRFQGASEADRHREKRLIGMEKCVQAQLEAAVADMHAHIDAHNTEIAELLAHIGLSEPYHEFMDQRKGSHSK